MPTLMSLLFSVLSLALPMPMAQQQQAIPRAVTRSPHGTLAQSCENCHTFTTWKPIRNLPEFNHDKTRYPLRGMHTNVTCTQCHTKLLFTNVGQKCADCHADIHRRQFGGTCEQCHTVKGWQVSIQQIRQHQNRFPLVGAHAAAECESCHRQAAAGRFVGLSTDCYTCHSRELKTATIDHAGFGTTCETCHTMNSWAGAKFDHARVTGFALTGMHATLECSSCHLGGKYKGTAADCFSCHGKDFNATTNPNHVQGGFPRNCAVCHSTATWTGAKFDHTALTKFPLTGAHANVQCQQCHVNGKFAGTPTDCASCHLNDFNGTTNPNHKAAGLPTTCITCHTTAAWRPASFDHAKTGFPLTGAHSRLACTTCHLNGNFSGQSPNCVSCHLNDFNGTTDPNHKAAGFPTDCMVCHSTTAWKPAQFNHSKTAFPLTGAHANVQCAQCHVGGKFAGTPTDCASCHLNDFNGTTDPNHKTSGFPTSCITCHSTTAWKPAAFDHSKTGFPLTGMHATAQCVQCHVNGKYAGTPKDCASCHINDFNKTTNPNHKAAAFPTDCSICHSSQGWRPASFDHSKTGFPLTGAHANVACSSCHLNGVFTGQSPNCVSCHVNDFNGTTDPNHKTAGFPTDCIVCHTTSAWKPASFDHSKTGFALTGAHTTVACANCHVGGRYAGTPTDCYTCHKPEYTGTTNPNHVAAQFPTTCNTCHSTSNWSGASFNHTWFPIYSGTHAGKWTTCGDCHVNSANYAVFSCITCHTHDQATVVPKHRDVRNFVYSATSCYSCHPSGRGD